MLFNAVFMCHLAAIWPVMVKKVMKYELHEDKNNVNILRDGMHKLYSEENTVRLSCMTSTILHFCTVY